MISIKYAEGRADENRYRMLPSPKVASFDEPVEMLEACHERIEGQLATLERLAPHHAAHGADAPARQAATAVMRYFDTAGVKHHQDEDEDLFPLLRGLAAEQGRADVAAMLDDLAREHVAMRAQWERMRVPLAAIAAQQATRLDAGEVARFAQTYRAHIEREERVVLAFAREAITAGQRAALGGKMSGRRKIAT